MDSQKIHVKFINIFFLNITALDEATSQIGLEAEHKMYVKCRELGITLLSVGHRDSLRQYHHVELHLEGGGNWTLRPITDNLLSQSDA